MHYCTVNLHPKLRVEFFQANSGIFRNAPCYPRYAVAVQ